MKPLRVILLAIAAVAISVLVAGEPHGSGGEVAEASGRARHTENSAVPATLTSLQQGLIDNFDGAKFGFIETEAGEVAGFTTQGIVHATSPWFWRALGKAMVVGGSTALGALVAGPGGCAVGAAASATFVSEANRRGSVVQDIFLYTDVTVAGQGNILPAIVELGSANITDTISLDAAFGTGSSISFVDPLGFPGSTGR